MLNEEIQLPKNDKGFGVSEWLQEVKRLLRELDEDAEGIEDTDQRGTDKDELDEKLGTSSGGKHVLKKKDQ